MLFSILIANYNNSRFLGTALKSVIAQSYVNWEIIIVDDASTDDFKTAIIPYLSDRRIKVFSNDINKGCGYTKRKCAGHAIGFLLGFLDPDDSLMPDALEAMAKAHINRPECSLIHSTHYICDAEMKRSRIADYPKALPPDTPYLLLNDGRIHHFASFKKNFYDNTGGISPFNRKAVDQDLYYKLEEAGGVFFINQPLYNYRIHDGSISNSGKEKEATLWHYPVIEEACLRRIKELKSNKQIPGSGHWIKKYKTHYYKIRILSSFRKKSWTLFLYSLAVFPFVGGWKNLLSYARKLPFEGTGLLKKSFTDTYEIKL